MAVAVLGSGNAQFGVPLPEVGISVKEISVDYFPEINQPIDDNVGERRGEVRSTKVSRDITMSGEVTGASGVMAWNFTTACVPANNVSRIGDGTGTILADKITITDERAEWEMFSAQLHSRPGVVL